MDGVTDPDIGIVRINLSAIPWGAVGATANLIVSVSLHALARRFQRGFDTTDGAILSELRELALRHTSIIKASSDFSVAFDGGCWVGEVARTETFAAPVLAIRTFTPADASGRGTAFAA